MDIDDVQQIANENRIASAHPAKRFARGYSAGNISSGLIGRRALKSSKMLIKKKSEYYCG